ncbi:MAG: hypothetical protein ABIX37_09500 [Gammaproteobacteria bacterium]
MTSNETHLLSLDSAHADERLALRRAYLTGRPVRTALIRRSRLVRVVDYSETYLDGRYEIAVEVSTTPADLSADLLVQVARPGQERPT